MKSGNAGSATAFSPAPAGCTDGGAGAALGFVVGFDTAVCTWTGGVTESLTYPSQ